MTQNAVPSSSAGKAQMTSDRTETIVAADVGGTNMRAALIASDGEILFRHELPTPHHAKVPTQLTELIHSAANHQTTNRPAPTHVVVGMPGQIDYVAGKLLWAPHLPKSWPELLSASQLSTVIGLPVHLANDADVAAVGEAYFGSGKEHRDVAYITISTGMGSGLVFGGRLLRGTRSIAEIGHTIVDWEAARELKAATLEETASGSGMTRLADAAGLGAISAKEIDELMKAGDKLAIGIWEQAIFVAAVGIANLVTCFSPEIVVLGGGLGLQPNFFTAVSAAAQHNVQARSQMVPIVLASLGDNAGLVGAAGWTAATS